MSDTAAYHEAGHCIAALVQGATVKRAICAADGEGIVTTHFRIGRTPEQEADRLWKRAITDLAGPAAEEVQNALALAQGNISAAINSLLAPFAREAFEELKKLDQQVAPRLAFLRFILEIGTERGPRLRDDDVGELRAEEALRRPLDGLRADVNDYFAQRGAGAEAIRRAWAQTREELRTDPDAPFPDMTLR
jgi:hypothetical protein